MCCQEYYVRLTRNKKRMQSCFLCSPLPWHILEVGPITSLAIPSSRSAYVEFGQPWWNEELGTWFQFIFPVNSLSWRPVIKLLHTISCNCVPHGIRTPIRHLRDSAILLSVFHKFLALHGMLHLYLVGSWIPTGETDWIRGRSSKWR